MSPAARDRPCDRECAQTGPEARARTMTIARRMFELVAPMGLVPAEVVDALFYNFAPGEVARHIPKVWRTITPEGAIAARQRGCVKALRRILGDRVGTAAFA